MRCVWPSLALGVVLAARAAAAQCPDGRPLTGELGITGFQCVGAGCAVNVFDEHGVRHRFGTEPSIVGVQRPGPADGRLRAGDVVVAVDGLLITTLEAGRRLANLAPGDTVTLTIRRGSETVDVALVPRRGCNTVSLDVRRER